MSKPASASPPYTGSPLGDPGAQKIGQFTALLSRQQPTFQAAVASVRAGLRSHQPGYVPMPFSVELIMSDGTRIKSQVVYDGTISNPTNGNVRLVLAKWDGSRFTRAIIDIEGDEMMVAVHRNPPELQNEWRRANPTILPPDVHGTNA